MQVISKETMPKKLPPDPDSMNEGRARRAGTVLSFCNRYGETLDYPATKQEVRDNLEGKLADLVADFAHMCDREGLNMARIVRGAARRYSATTDGLGSQLKIARKRSGR
jgi:hypothetical protein